MIRAQYWTPLIVVAALTIGSTACATLSTESHWMPPSRIQQYRELGIEPEEMVRASPRELSSTETLQLMTKRHYFMATYLGQSGRIREALDQLALAHKHDPDNYYVLLLQSEYQLTVGNTLEALQGLNRILAAMPNDASALLLKAQAMLQQAETAPRARRTELTQGALAVLQAARKAQPRNETVLRALVRLHARMNDLKGLESAYRDLVEAAPKDPGSKLMLARLLSETNRPEESLEFYDKVINQRRSFIPARMEKARLQELLGRLDQAAETYLEAILIEPRNRAVREAFDRVLRMIHQGEGARDKILKAYADFSARYPYSSEIRRIYAEKLLNAGDRDGAIREFRKIVEADDNNPEAHLNLGKLLLSLNRTTDALIELRRAHELAPDSPEILSLMGSTLLANGQASEALDIFRRALRDLPDNPDLQLGLAAVLIESRQADNALEIINSALPKIRRDSALLAQAGQLLLRARNTPRAAQVLAEAAAANPTDPSILALAIRAHARSNRIDEAVALADRARAARIALPPAEVYLLLAEEFQAAGYYTDAERWYSRAIESAPDRLGILARLVSLNNIQDKHNRSLELIAQARKDQPDSDELLQLEAAVHLDAGQYDQAIELYRQLRDRRPGSVEPVALLAEALATAKRGDQALAELERAERKFGKTDDLDFARGIVQLRLRKLDQAARIFRAIVEKKGHRALDARFFLATTLVDLKNYDEAEKVYREGLAEAPEDARFLNGLGYLLADRNTHLNEARTLIEKALELQPRAGHIIDSMAWLLYREGRFEEAYDWICESLAFSGKDAEILEHKGMILEALQRNDEAIEAYRKALAAEPNRPTAKERLDSLTRANQSSNNRAATRR